MNVSEILRTLKNIEKLEAENTRLRTENTRLRTENTRLRKVNKDNEAKQLSSPNKRQRIGGKKAKAKAKSKSKASK